MSAAASKINNQAQNVTSIPTSQPTDLNGYMSMEQRQNQQNQQQHQQRQQGQRQQAQQGQQDPFAQHEGNDAANGLLFLAQNTRQQNYGMPQHPSQQIHTNMPMGQMGGQPQEPSPRSKKANKDSIGSISGSGENGEFSDSGSEDAKPSRLRGKKGANGKGQAAGTRRKAEDSAQKTPAKRAKNNNGSISAASMEPLSDDEGMSPKNDEEIGGRKMTDEEKRKNFLERNR